MFCAKVASENLNTKRLDSDFYRPDYVEIDNTLSRLNCVKLSVVGKFFTGPFGSKLPSNLYLDEGVPLFRVGNVGQFEVLSENFAYLAPAVHDELKTSEVLPGDLLIVKASVGEKICKMPEWLPKANITQHIIGIRPNQSKDTDYVSAFLFSYYGVGQLQRYSLGSIIQYLGITDAKGVSLYSPDPLAQKYIGDKVRQAEQLRAWAKRLEAKADREINNLFHFDHIDSLTLKPRRMVPQVLSTMSLAPEFARATDCQRTFENATKLSAFIEQCKCGDPIKSEDRVSGPYFYYGASGPIDTHSEFNFNGEYLIVAQDGSIGCANVANGRFWANNHVWVLKIKEDYDVESICRFLGKHFPCWKGVTTGSVVPKVTSENLLNILIPVNVAKSRDIGDKLRFAVSATKYSEKLTVSAKTLVEALIEGQLTEQQLIRAQQALEDGDTTLDQAILSKLSSEGYAIEGATPLFSDLDELYRLLESAAQAGAEE